MVIGTHDSMIAKKMAAMPYMHGSTLVTPSLVPRLDLEKLISIALTLIE